MNATKQICSTSKENKTRDKFSYRNDTKKYRNQCICCYKTKKQEYRQNNKTRIKNRDLIYKSKNREYINKQAKEYYTKNKETILNKQKTPDELKKRRMLGRLRRLNNPSVIIYEKAYSLKNKTHLLEHRNKRNKERYMLDKQYKLRVLLRNRILKALKGSQKSDHTIQLLGCSINTLQIHLEKLFQSGMTWSNHGKWEIDHIRPCASFDLNDPKQQIECFHYTNLQPLWAKDNRFKGSKW